MHERSSRRGEDENEAAFRIAEIATAEGSEKPKHPAAVALGRLGGLKGGKARAKALSGRRRKEIAKKAAVTRWGKGRGQTGDSKPQTKV